MCRENPASHDGLPFGNHLLNCELEVGEGSAINALPKFKNARHSLRRRRFQVLRIPALSLRKSFNFLPLVPKIEC